MKINMCRFFLFLIYICVLLLDIQLSRWEAWDIINRFKLATFFPCLNPRPELQMAHDVVFSYVQRVMVIGDRSL
jgi:hypothetical protein